VGRLRKLSGVLSDGYSGTICRSLRRRLSRCLLRCRCLSSRSLSCNAVSCLLRRSLGRRLRRCLLSRRLLLCLDLLMTSQWRARSGSHVCQRRRARRTGGWACGKERDERDGRKPDTSGRNVCNKRSSSVGHPTPQIEATLRRTGTYEIKQIAYPHLPLVGLDVGEKIGHFVPVAISPRPGERPQEPVSESHAVTVRLTPAVPEGRPVNVLVRTRC
jgi:hypothetical protein